MSGSIGFYCLGWSLFLEEEGFNVGGFGFFRVDYLLSSTQDKNSYFIGIDLVAILA